MRERSKGEKNGNWKVTRKVERIKEKKVERKERERKVGKIRLRKTEKYQNEL